MTGPYDVMECLRDGRRARLTCQLRMSLAGRHISVVNDSESQTDQQYQVENGPFFFTVGVESG